MRNIRYIGSDPICKAFHLQTGIIWTTGMVDTVLDDAVADKMLKYTSVFEDAGGSIGLSIVVSADAPVDADGRPEGTIYIQVA